MPAPSAEPAEQEPPVNLYPIALDLRGRVCVVVGGGAVGIRKAEGLFAVGACVTIIDPNPKDNCSYRWIAEPFAPQHLDGAFLAIAATDNSIVNRTVVAAARERGILINQASAASVSTGEGDFATMATVRRGELLIAMTTGGAGPALSARLRAETEERFGPEWEAYVSLLRDMRERARGAITDSRLRTDALRRLASADSVRLAIKAGDMDSARQEALACLS